MEGTIPVEMARTLILLSEMIEVTLQDQSNLKFEPLDAHFLKAEIYRTFDVHFKSVIYRSLGDRERALAESRASQRITMKCLRSSAINSGYKILLPLFHDACCFLQYRQFEDLEETLQNLVYFTKTYKFAASAEKVFKEEIRRIQEIEGPAPLKRKLERNADLQSEIEYQQDSPATLPLYPPSNASSFSSNSAQIKIAACPIIFRPQPHSKTTFCMVFSPRTVKPLPQR